MPLTDQDRRAPHREDRTEALRLHFHPEVAADPERRQLMDKLDEWLAELAKEQGEIA